MGYSGWRADRHFRVGPGRLRPRAGGLAPLDLAAPAPGATRTLAEPNHPSIGDQLLGIIELVASESEQARSLTLCEAAIEQVAETARARDFTDAVPNPKHRRWAGLALGTLAIGLGLLLLFPAAAANAWARFLMPWHNTPRYTFAMVHELPDRLVVAHGEPFTMTVKLAEQTVWRPSQAEAQIGVQPPVVAQRADDRYEFELPPQIDAGWLDVRVGDFTKHVRVEPTLRPELTSWSQTSCCRNTSAGRTAGKKDVRGGTVSLVKGSRATFTATARRELTAAQGRRPAGRTPGHDRDQSARARRRHAPRGVSVAGSVRPGRQGAVRADDQRPATTKRLRLRVRISIPQSGPRYGASQLQGDGPGRFRRQAHRHGVAGNRYDQLQEPGGGRTHPGGGRSGQGAAGASRHVLGHVARDRAAADSGAALRRGLSSPAASACTRRPTCLYVLNAEQHAIWLTEQLSKWHRQSLEVRDRELQLFETNKQLRQLVARRAQSTGHAPPDRNQAEAERTNGRRLSDLVDERRRPGQAGDAQPGVRRRPSGEVGRDAADPERHLGQSHAVGRRPAEGSRAAPSVAQNAPANNAPMAGQVRAAARGKPAGAVEEEAAKKDAVPPVVDIESSQQPPDPNEKPPPPSESQGGSPRLTPADHDAGRRCRSSKPTTPARQAKRWKRPSRSNRICWPNSTRSPTSSIAFSPISKAARWSSG